VFQKFRGRSDLDQLSQLQHPDAVAQSQCITGIVSDNQYCGGSFHMEQVEIVTEFVLNGQIEGRKGFIEEPNGPILHHEPSPADPLAFPARQLMRSSCQKVIDPSLLSDARDPGGVSQ
jgi:hypothetical protein